MLFYVKVILLFFIAIIAVINFRHWVNEGKDTSDFKS